MFQLISSFLLVIIFFGCGSHPVIPKSSDIKVSREDAAKTCKSLGVVEGRATNVNASSEDALADLQSEAVKKGANFVKIETMGAQGTAIRGEAFWCP